MRQLVIHEGLAAVLPGLGDARGDDRVVGRLERQLVDDDDRERIARHVDALPETLAPQQHGVAGFLETREELVLRCVALHQQGVVPATKPEGIGQQAARLLQRAQAGEQDEGTAAADFQHRQGSVDDGFGELGGVRRGQALRHVEHALARVVERAVDAQGFGGLDPQAGFEVSKIAADRQRGRGENPRLRAFRQPGAEHRAHRQRRRVQQQRTQRGFEPAHARLFGIVVALPVGQGRL